MKTTTEKMFKLVITDSKGVKLDSYIDSEEALAGEKEFWLGKTTWGVPNAGPGPDGTIVMCEPPFTYPPYAIEEVQAEEGMKYRWMDGGEHGSRWIPDADFPD